MEPKLIKDIETIKSMIGGIMIALGRMAGNKNLMDDTITSDYIVKEIERFKKSCEPTKEEVQDIWDEQKSKQSEAMIKPQCKDKREDMVKDQHKPKTKKRVQGFKDIVDMNWKSHK